MRMGVWGAAATLMLASWSVSAAGSASLPTETIKVETAHGAHAFSVEVAADTASQERGLMYRDQMAADHGMLFDFHQPETVAFWMKNTKLPLDMVFIRADGTISTIMANAQPYSTKQIPSAEPVRAVLEINGGQAGALGIHPGDRVLASMFGY
jgi:uncharacterized membrane protein (UPF0127 family)